MTTKKAFLMSPAIIFSAIFLPNRFYRYIGVRGKRKNLLSMALMLLFAGMLLGIFSSPYASLLPLIIVISGTAYAIIASLFDPFVAWIRGHCEKPFKLFLQYLIFHLWPIVMSSVIVTIVYFVQNLFDSKTWFLSPYIIFIASMGAHQFILMKCTDGIRKEQKVVTAIVFTMMFIAQPAIIIAKDLF